MVFFYNKILLNNVFLRSSEKIMIFFIDKNLNKLMCYSLLFKKIYLKMAFKFILFLFHSE